MINRLIELCLRNRFIVVLLVAVLAGAGLWSLYYTPIDAIPNIGVNQQIVHVKWSGRSPQDIEDQVVYPLTTELMGVPGVETVRSTSMFGVGFINIIFEEGREFYWTRTRVLERLSSAQQELPDGATAELGPDATALGQVYWYTVENGYYCEEAPRGLYRVKEDGKPVDYVKSREQAPAKASVEPVTFTEPGTCPLTGKPLKKSELDQAELRSLQDWYVRYQLTAVPGVSEIASVGGKVKQYQINVDPASLQAHDISLHHVAKAVKLSNVDVGAKVIEEGAKERIVRGLGFLESKQDIENIVLSAPEDRPVTIKDVAEVTLGPDFRRGALDKNGQPATGGVVLMRFGENPLKVIQKVKDKVKQLEKGLPPGVQIVSFYDRTELIDRATGTLISALTMEAVVVVGVIFFFLASFFSGFIVVIVLPLGVLIAMLGMYLLGMPSNIMSLGGIAISVGVMVDAGIVMTENIHRHLSRIQDGDESWKRWEAVKLAAKEVGPAVFFAILIIVVAFLQIFALKGQAGKLFLPLATTATLTMSAAVILSLVFVPLLCGFLLGRRAESLTPPSESTIAKALNNLYRPILTGAMRWRWAVLVGALVLILVTIPVMTSIQSEFMPPLNEGDLLYMPMATPAASMTRMNEILHKQNRIISSFPEVESAVGKIGHANTATDPAPVNMVETIVQLKPRSEWRSVPVKRWFSSWPRWLKTPLTWLWPESRRITRDELRQRMDAKLQFPGLNPIWTQPIRNRIDMLSTGIQTPVGLKIFGDEPEKLQQLANRAEDIIAGVEGSESPYAERSSSKPYLNVNINREEAARYGLHVQDIQDVIMTAAGGMNLTTTVEGRERYPVRVRYPRELRNSPEDLKEILVPNRWMWRNAPPPHQVPLGQVADIERTQGPASILSENTLMYKRVFVGVDTSKTGLINFVDRARTAINEKLDLPAGYYVEFSGQYEAEMESRQRLMWIVPVCIGLIALLLYLKFGEASSVFIVMTSVIFAFVGGVWLQWIMGVRFSTAVWVGYIALFGVAVEAGVVLVDYLEDLYRKQDKKLAYSVIKASRFRVRPIVMTSVTTIFALVPILFQTGAGSEVMIPIAVPTVGGMVTATLANLILTPAMFFLVERFKRSEDEAVVIEDETGEA